MQEYVSGGELFDYIVAHQRVKEKEARRLFRQLLSAVQYCHVHWTCHRDLKPENVLLDENLDVKLVDFGFATIARPGHAMSTYCGSPAYAAPEMVTAQRYSGPEADIWSMGVILFTLLAGYLPFDDDNPNRLYRRITRASYTFPSHMSAGPYPPPRGGRR